MMNMNSQRMTIPRRTIWARLKEISLQTAMRRFTNALWDSLNFKGVEPPWNFWGFLQKSSKLQTLKSQMEMNQWERRLPHNVWNAVAHPSSVRWAIQMNGQWSTMEDLRRKELMMKAQTDSEGFQSRWNPIFQMAPHDAVIRIRQQPLVNGSSARKVSQHSTPIEAKPWT